MSQLHWSTWNQQNPCGMVPTCLAVGHLCWGCFRSTLASFPQSLRMMGRIIQEHDLAIPWGITSELQGPVKNFQLPSKLIYLLSSPRTAKGQRSRANMYVYLYIYIYFFLCVCARACHCIHDMFCNSDITLYTYIHCIHMPLEGDNKPGHVVAKLHSMLAAVWAGWAKADARWRWRLPVETAKLWFHLSRLV